MGKYEELKDLPAKQFKRLTGVQRETFEKMVDILVKTQNERYRRAGRKSSLSIKDKLLMALEDLREYRTHFHLGRSYGLSESACERCTSMTASRICSDNTFSIISAPLRLTVSALIMRSTYCNSHAISLDSKDRILKNLITQDV